MSFVTETTLISAHAAGITVAAGTRFTLTQTGQPDPKADQMSIWPDVVLLLATRCLTGGGVGAKGVMGWRVHLTKHQPDPQSDQMSCWPAVVSLFSTRCLYWGWGCTLENSRWSIEHCRQKNMSSGQWDASSYHSWPPDASAWGHRGMVHLTKHQPDPQADQMSCWPAVVPLLTTSCLYWWCRWGGGIKGPMDHRGISGGIGVTSENSRWSIAKYSSKLKTVYWTLQTIEHELRWTGPKLVPLLATRCLYQGFHLTEGQPDPKADQMLNWPDILLLLATRCH